MDGVTAAPATCTATFELTAADAARKVSVRLTHGDFHPVTLDATGQPVGGGQGAHGTVTLAWSDPTGALIAAYSCPTVALNADYNPTELTRLHCTETTAQKASFTPGVQTLTVTATELANQPVTGIRVVGRINLGDPGSI